MTLRTSVLVTLALAGLAWLLLPRPVVPPALPAGLIMAAGMASGLGSHADGQGRCMQSRRSQSEQGAEAEYTGSTRKLTG